MCDNICNKKIPGPDRGPVVLTDEARQDLKMGDVVIPYKEGHPPARPEYKPIPVLILRRHHNEMSSIPMARGYIVCATENKVTHWVRIDKIKRLREKCIQEAEKEEQEDGSLKTITPAEVVVLFDADGLSFEVQNTDVIQFLLEVDLAREVKGDGKND